MYVCLLSFSVVVGFFLWVYSIFFIKKRWIVLSRRVFDSDCIQSCLYSTSLFVNTTNNCVIKIKKEKKIPFHNTNRHGLGALQIPNILSFSSRVSRSLKWSTLFSEVILHRIHHVIIGQIFSNHTQRQETFSCHKPVTLLLVSNQTGYMSKSRAPADVRCHSLYPLLFSISVTAISRQKYNEFVLCLKKNEGEEDACLKQKQLAFSICPDDWVGYLANNDIAFDISPFIRLLSLILPLLSFHVMLRRDCYYYFVVVLLIIVLVVVIINVITDLQLGRATSQRQLLGHPRKGSGPCRRSPLIGNNNPCQ